MVSASHISLFLYSTFGSTKEIAHALNMSEKGVAAIYYRTVKKLRDMLEGGE